MIAEQQLARGQRDEQDAREATSSDVEQHFADALLESRAHDHGGERRHRPETRQQACSAAEMAESRRSFSTPTRSLPSDMPVMVAIRRWSACSGFLARAQHGRDRVSGQDQGGEDQQCQCREHLCYAPAFR